MAVIIEIGMLVTENSDWRWLQEALLRMSTISPSYPVKMTNEQDDSLVIGGGDDGRYIVSYFPHNHPDSPSLSLIDPTLTGPDVPLIVQTDIEVAPKYAVRSNLILHVAQYFFRTGQLPMDVFWESDFTREVVLGPDTGRRKGQQVGAYLLHMCLASSPQAEVYLDSTEQVVVKIFSRSLTQEDMAHFSEEGERVKERNHSHVLPILEVGVVDNRPFVVMPFVPGAFTVALSHIQGMPLALPLVLLYIRQVSDALHYLHSHGAIHGNVKPSNMLLGTKRHIWLGDSAFPVLTAQMSPLERVQHNPYLAPEQLQGQAVYASDQYALAACMYELLAGELPFSGTPEEILHGHLYQLPAALHTKVPKLSKRVEAVIFHALAKNPEERFPDIVAFQRALEEAVQ